MRTLHTPRLVLEPLTARHATAMFSVLGDLAIYRHLDEAPPATLELLRRQYAAWELRRSPDGRERWLNWVVFGAQSQALGYVQATVLPDAEAWVAYVLGSAHWGQGYAQEAVAAMMRHVQQEHPVHQWLAMVEAGNERSIRLLQRLGFQPADAAAGRRHPPEPGERLFARGASEHRSRQLQLLLTRVNFAGRGGR